MTLIIITVEPLNMDTFGTSFVERFVLFQHSVYTRVLLACPLLGGLSSFGVSFIGGFTVSSFYIWCHLLCYFVFFRTTVQHPQGRLPDPRFSKFHGERHNEPRHNHGPPESHHQGNTDDRPQPLSDGSLGHN